MSSSPTSNPEPSEIFYGSSYIKLQTITHGGRSLFATEDIGPGTRIHAEEGPFAHMIYKDYRKEVCAYCFAYSASDHAPPSVGPSRTWRIKSSRVGAATAWFCSGICKNNWEGDKISCLLMEVDALLTKGQAATRKQFRSPDEKMKVKSMLPSFDPENRSFTPGAIDRAWESAKTLIASKADLALYYSTLHLDVTELEIARLLAAAIVRRYCDDLSPSGPASRTRLNQIGSWQQLLNLQDNELRNIQRRPYMLTAYLRIYVFLSNALPDYLRKYTFTIREVLARDSGNAFGIWDGDRRDEMMGWGIWVSASYFNHSCTPNVRKGREGRTLYFEVTRSVQAGEELCISYIDTDSPVEQRRQELEESWFFTCRCLRCEGEAMLSHCLV